MYLDAVFPAQVGPVQAAVSLAAVTPLTDGWARVALALGKPQQHMTGSSLGGAQLGQVDVQGCRRVIVGPSGGRVRGVLTPVL